MLSKKYESILKYYSEIRNIVKDCIGKNFDIKVTHNDTYIKSNIKIKLELIFV